MSGVNQHDRGGWRAKEIARADHDYAHRLQRAVSHARHRADTARKRAAHFSDPAQQVAWLDEAVRFDRVADEYERELSELAK